MNPHCECKLAGFCTRHKITKSQRHFDLCQGSPDKSQDCGHKFWMAWESGKMNATIPENPIEEPDWCCVHDKPLFFAAKKNPVGKISVLEAGSVSTVGLGDKVSQALSVVGITDERVSAWLGRPCGCPERRAKLNRLGAWVGKILGGDTEAAEVDLNEMVQ